jgi:hypothetical protein
MAAEMGSALGRISASPERCIAIAFSLTMRQYSAVEQLPAAIMSERRAIVSEDARVISASRIGSGSRRRLRDAMRCEHRAAGFGPTAYA